MKKYLVLAFAAGLGFATAAQPDPLASPAMTGPITSNGTPGSFDAGFGTVYSLSIAVFGGTTQLIVTWLIHVTGSPMAPAWYMIGGVIVGMVAQNVIPESAPIKVGLGLPRRTQAR